MSYRGASMTASVFAPGVLSLDHLDPPPQLDAEIDLGKRLSQLRLSQHLSLEKVAGDVGMTRRQLQKIEAGSISPKIAVLQQLLTSLGSDFEAILAREEGHCRSRRSITLAGSGCLLRQKQASHRVLASELLQKRMLPRISTLKQGAGEWSAHEGEAFIMVLKGQVRMLAAYYAPLLLNEGDSIYFDGNMRYQLCVDDAAVAEVAWLTCR